MRALFLCLLLIASAFAAGGVTEIRCDSGSVGSCGGGRVACNSNFNGAGCTIDGVPYATWVTSKNLTLVSGPGCGVNPWQNSCSGGCIYGYGAIWVGVSF